MRSAMALVRMKEKGQVTIPAAVRGLIDAHKGDVFEVMVSDGNIVLTPQQVVSRRQPAAEVKPVGRKAKSPIDISKYIGIARGVYGSTEEIDKFIRNERESWG